MHNADLVHDNSTLQDKLEEIYALRRTRSKVNWDRDQFLDLLKHFGNPHLDLPPVIHVAGTNGKGSVIAILRSILEAQGYRVHVYTSPHLINVNERIVLAGEDITDSMLSGLIDQALAFVDGAPLSFFEIMTAIAFRAFADEPADVVLLEVGLGGRLDCTNVISRPLACVINHVSLDHTDFLGNSLELIAAEKAGILKSNVPCVVGRQKPDVYRVIEEKAIEVGASIVSDWSVDDTMNFIFEGQSYHFPMPSLNGLHQVRNAGLALALLFSIRKSLPVSEDAMSAGLKNVKWRARLQNIDPSVYGVDGAYEILLDSGHNDSAGQVIAHYIEPYEQPVYLVMGMLRTKNIEAFLLPIRPKLAGIYVVPLAGDECYLSADVRGSFSCDSVAQAIEDITSKTERACILIAGSVYLAGEVLKTLRGTL